ncbi:MAG: histidine kinase [Gammaproteobacteria bacterium]|nr:histidine kinase [Gammaproteobacteria bacterium]
MIESGQKQGVYLPGFFNAWFNRLDQRNRGLLNSGRFRIISLLVGLLVLLVLIATISFSALPAGVPGSLSAYIPWFSAAAIVLVVILAFTVWRVLLDPLLRLCKWADLMRGVNLDARVNVDHRSDFYELANDINMLGNMINQLSRETEIQLQKHTDYISRESKSLAILYDVTSSINVSRDINELFQKSLDSLCQNLRARAGVIRQIIDSSKLEVVAIYGDVNKLFLDNVDNLLPYRASSEQSFRGPEKLSSIIILDPAETDDDEMLQVVSVPMLYRDNRLGVINLFFPQSENTNLDNYNELLLSIGQHLGTALDRYRLDEDESQLLLLQERTRLSHELHDSLAQTMASLRIQVRILDEIFHSGDEPGIWDQLERVEYTIEQANNELRELIAHFRIPMNKRGFISSIEESIRQIQQDTDIKIYLQNEWTTEELPASMELQVLRIVQECLANIRKHSQAGSVRILLRALRAGGEHYILIEDDGIGFDETKIEPVGGQHLGLSILRDRAAQINGEITIDSEPGDGTRITLQFAYPDTGQH